MNISIIIRAEDDPVRGFLISCDKNKEKQAVKDAYNFLTEVDIGSRSTLS